MEFEDGWTEDIYTKLLVKYNGDENKAYPEFMELHNGGLLAAMEKEVSIRKRSALSDLIGRTD